MKIHPLIKKVLPYLVCIIVPLIILAPKSHRHKSEAWRVDLPQAKCVIALPKFKSSRINYSVGYNHEILKLTGDLLDCEMDIVLSEDKKAALDSLENGYFDVAVLPYGDSALIGRTEIAFCPVMEDSTVWIIPKDGNIPPLLLSLGLDGVRSRTDYPAIMGRFAPTYEPFSRLRSGLTYSNASPYDALFKQYSKQLGCDWRMLTAMAWQESMFRIEANSHRGAYGLMQTIPSTAKAYGDSACSIDPEISLIVATKYLKLIKKAFDGKAEGDDIYRFVLAAYNGGENRLQGILRRLAEQGLPNTKWEDIKAYHKGETVKYVDRVDSIYQALKVIVP